MQKWIPFFKNKYKFLENIPTELLRSPIEDLDKAFQNFFKHDKNYPKFKKKSTAKRNFRYAQGCTIKNGKLRISNIGFIKINLHKELEGKIKRVTVTNLPSGKWVASILYQCEQPKVETARYEKVGIDLGVETLAIPSAGKKLKNKRYFKKFESKLIRLQRKKARGKFKSNNTKKLKIRIAKIHEKIRSSRDFAINQWIHNIVNKNQVIVLEDLSVKEMAENPDQKMAKNLLDAKLGFFRLRTTRKAIEFGRSIILVDKYFPSSQLCSCCNHRNKLELSVRSFRCEKCNTLHNRDKNAAKNLFNYKPSTVGSTGTLKDAKGLTAQAVEMNFEAN
jgi:putative transposase